MSLTNNNGSNHAAASTSHGQLSSLEIIKRRRKCSKLLFGQPDHDSVDEWLNKNAIKHTREAQSRWGFDFEHGIPLSNGNDEQSSSDFVYERIEEQEVPKFYRTPPAKRRPARAHPYKNNEPSEKAVTAAAIGLASPIKRSTSTPAITHHRTIEHRKIVVTQTASHHLESPPKPHIRTTPKKPSNSKRRSQSTLKSPRKSAPKPPNFERVLPAKVY